MRIPIGVIRRTEFRGEDYLKLAVLAEEAVLEKLLDAPVGAREVAGGGGILTGLVEEQPDGAQGVAIHVHQRTPHDDQVPICGEQMQASTTMSEIAVQMRFRREPTTSMPCNLRPQLRNGNPHCAKRPLPGKWRERGFPPPESTPNTVTAPKNLIIYPGRTLFVIGSTVCRQCGNRISEFVTDIIYAVCRLCDSKRHHRGKLTGPDFMSISFTS